MEVVVELVHLSGCVDALDDAAIALSDGIRARGPNSREVLRMAQKPLDTTGKPSAFVGIRFSQAALDRVDAIAEREGTTRSDLIRQALAALVAQRETAA